MTEWRRKRTSAWRNWIPLCLYCSGKVHFSKRKAASRGYCRMTQWFDINYLIFQSLVKTAATVESRYFPTLKECGFVFLFSDKKKYDQFCWGKKNTFSTFKDGLLVKAFLPIRAAEQIDIIACCVRKVRQQKCVSESKKPSNDGSVYVNGSIRPPNFQRLRFLGSPRSF